jgi:F-type H+-transporting ATPase subunit b
MKHFLYKPVLDAIDAREKRIAAELAEADAKKAEAQKDRDDFQRRNEAFDHDRAALLKKATDDANGERERLLDAARKSADELTMKRQETLKADAENLNQSLRDRTRQEVFAIARKALADLATASLDDSMCELFIHRLRGLDESARTSLGAAFGSATGPLLVRSAFELRAALRAAVQQAVDETFALKATLRFETAPDLVGGIELSANGQKLAWSISDYLGSLERSVGELLQPEAVSKAVPPAVARTVSKEAPKAAAKVVAEPAPS